MPKCKECNSETYSRTTSFPLTEDSACICGIEELCMCDSIEYAQKITDLARLYNLTERFPEEKRVLLSLLKGEYKYYQDKFADMITDIDKPD